MCGLFWDLYQNHRISQVEQTANSAHARAQSASRDVQSRLDSLALMNAALWSLLQERLGLTETDLANRVREIDLRDGVLDGKIAHGVAACPACGRTTSTRRGRCI